MPTHRCRALVTWMLPRPLKLFMRFLQESPALDLSLQADDSIAFDDPQGFRVNVDLQEIGGGFVERVHTTVPLHCGSVTSVSDLLLLRTKTVSA